MQDRNTAPPGVQRSWRGADDYQQAVEGAAVTELPATSSGTGHPENAAGVRREGDNRPTVPSPKPSPRPVPRASWDEAERNRANAEFVAWILSEHEAHCPDGGIPMCRCGYPARTCMVRQQAHTILGFPSPWSQPAPTYVSA